LISRATNAAGQSQPLEPEWNPNGYLYNAATFDTSVYIRAFNFGGPAATLLAHARIGTIRIDTSDHH